MRQSLVAFEPDPVAAAVAEPLFRAESERAVVGVLDRQLQQDLIGWPRFVAPAQDVRLLAEERLDDAKGLILTQRAVLLQQFQVFEHTVQKSESGLLD